jgi:hypothetical protein
MKRLLIGIGLVAAMAAPANAAATGTKADKHEAKRECRQLQKAVETRANFVQVVKLEARANRGNAFGRCVKVRTKHAANERRKAFKAAKAACKSLRPGHARKHGKPSNPGAYGKCVSAAARRHRAKSDARQARQGLNPAKTCRAKQADGAAFRAEFPGKNGFGKCVSKEARSQPDQYVDPFATA